MYQRIHEEISVLGIFKNHKFIPKKFNWGNKTYSINEITLISDIKDGGVRKRLYSVVSSANVYRLEFNRETEAWLLEEIWLE